MSDQPQVTSENWTDVDDIMLDPESLDKEFHYRFINSRGPRWSRAAKQGYTPVSRTEDGVRLVGEGAVRREDESADDHIRDGDRILCKIPKNRFKERRGKIAALNRARLSAPEGQFRKKARQADPRIRITNKASKEDLT